MRELAGIIILVVIGGTLIAFFFLQSTPKLNNAVANDRSVTNLDPNLKSNASVHVHGWTKPELDQILKDFSKSYGKDSPRFAVTGTASNTFVITFPQDIKPKILFFLVNYIHYPNNFDLTQKAVGAYADATVTSAFGAPTQIGKRVKIYVPLNDKEYDLVYAAIGSMTYEISFTDLAWRQVTGGRVPAWILSTGN